MATEACRQAENCEDFVVRVLQETGIRLEVISNREEVGLAADGCVPLLDAAIPNALIFDIGGGSTEISWLKVAASPGVAADGAAARANPTPQCNGQVSADVADWCSLPFGVVSFAERFSCREVSPETYEAMASEVAAEAGAFEAQVALGPLVSRQAVQLLGTSGTVTTLTGVHLQLPRYDRAQGSMVTAWK